MTPQSATIAVAATFVIALFGGWLLRERTTGRLWSFAVAAATGLLLFRTSAPADLLQNLKPVSAIGWILWIALAVAVVRSIRSQRLRITSALALGFAIPCRLLWGSVYFRHEIPTATVLAAMIVWALALAWALSISRPTAQRRISLPVAAWLLLVASSAAVVAATGSITYAAAIAVVGAGMFGHLFGSSRLPLEGGVIHICIIGLSVAFSETPLPIGMLLVAATLAVSCTSPEEAALARWSKPVQIAVPAIVTCVAMVSLSKMIPPSNQNGAASGYGGYQTADRSTDDFNPPEPIPSAASPPAEPFPEVADDDEQGMPDPFAGLGL